MYLTKMWLLRRLEYIRNGVTGDEAVKISRVEKVLFFILRSMRSQWGRILSREETE